MGLDNIISNIIKEAEEEAEKLRQNAQATAEKLIIASREEAEKKGAKLRQQAEQEGQVEALRILSQARLEKKLALLVARRKWVDMVLTKACEEVGLQNQIIKRLIVTRQGLEEEKIAEERFKEDLRVRYEKQILKLLGI